MVIKVGHLEITDSYILKYRFKNIIPHSESVLIEPNKLASAAAAIRGNLLSLCTSNMEPRHGAQKEFMQRL